MNKINLRHPTIITLYGYPGAGKTYLSRQLCEDLNIAHLQGDRIRFELFEQPRYDKQENQIVMNIMNYMAEEFLRAGISVVYDADCSRAAQRRSVRELARKSHARTLMIWLQIDMESAFVRVSHRDRRKSDDKFSSPIDRNMFDSLAGKMQNPALTEDYIVVSGKHNYHTQRSAIMKKMYEFSMLDTSSASAKLVKPGLVNLIPNPLAGRVDPTRRNIIIR